MDGWVNHVLATIFFVVNVYLWILIVIFQVCQGSAIQFIQFPGVAIGFLWISTWCFCKLAADNPSTLLKKPYLWRGTCRCSPANTVGSFNPP